MPKVVFIILSFEGPDVYSRAGGLGSRVTELGEALSEASFETHIFFIGDPNLPGHESLKGGMLNNHRWCQWISRYHTLGVYDGEEVKLNDWDRSLPTWLEKEVLEPKIADGAQVVIMGEEWQTSTSIIALHSIIVSREWSDRVRLLWNANNVFGFNRIDWEKLSRSAVITTVSRYMKHEMWRYGVDARVIPNGIGPDWFNDIEDESRASLAELFKDRLSLVKVARWDPDKRWNMAVDAVDRLKWLGQHPLLLAKGGVESHSAEVLDRAEQHGLGVVSVNWSGVTVKELVQSLAPAIHADVINLQGFLSQLQRQALYYAADAVLANSGVEPFGLVGLETMAAGGVAIVGATGEDYVTPGHDAVSVQTSDPHEIVYHAIQLKSVPGYASRLRLAGKNAASLYTWQAVIKRVVIPFLTELGIIVAEEVPSDNYKITLVFKNNNFADSTKMVAVGR